MLNALLKYAILYSELSLAWEYLFKNTEEFIATLSFLAIKQNLLVEYCCDSFYLELLLTFYYFNHKYQDLTRTCWQSYLDYIIFPLLRKNED